MEKKGYQIGAWLVFSELCILLVTVFFSEMIIKAVLLPREITMCLLQLLIAFPTLAGVAFLKIVYKDEKTKDILGFRSFDITMLLFFIVMSFCAQKFVSVVTAPINYLLTHIFGNIPSVIDAPKSVFEFFYLLFTVCIVAPVTEEIFFRGVIIKLLSPYGFLTAAILSSAMFSMLHMSPTGIIVIFWMGIVLAAVRYISGSVFACMVFHAFYNFYGCLETIFSEQITLMSGIYLKLTLICALFFLPVALLYKKTYPQAEFYQKKQDTLGISIGFMLTIIFFAAFCILILLNR